MTIAAILLSEMLFIIAIIAFLLAALFFSLYWRELKKQRKRQDSELYQKNRVLKRQKEKVENLLDRLLPKQTVAELQRRGKVRSKRFNMVTVLFSDIHGFTEIVSRMNPEELVDELDKFFVHFDAVVEKYNIEKIKTVGDAYMCAGGIPNKNRTNPVEVVLAALEIQHYMKTRVSNNGNPVWGLRIGIHSGPVIAGVVGHKRISYDIWGDTVNTASRMESSGVVGEINISGMTHMLVKDFFLCEYRGRMPIKYKGNTDMYFVKGFLPKLSSELDRLQPNKHFVTQFQILKYDDLEEIILNKLEKELPSNMHYHDLKHTIDVVTQVELIGREEKISDEEMLIIKTAALFHDLGFTLTYEDHENNSILLAKNILPDYGYNKEQIEEIVNLINHTKHPPRPKTLLEKIMCDADLDYLGRIDFIPVSENLYKELKAYNRVKNHNEWNKMQIRFIENHQYFTGTARRLRNVNKNKQLEKLRQLIG